MNRPEKVLPFQIPVYTGLGDKEAAEATSPNLRRKLFVEAFVVYRDVENIHVLLTFTICSC